MLGSYLHRSVDLAVNQGSNHQALHSPLLQLYACRDKGFFIDCASGQNSDARVRQNQWRIGDLQLARLHFNRSCRVAIECPDGISLLVWPTDPFENLLAQPHWVSHQQALELGASANQDWLCVAVNNQRLDMTDSSQLNRIFQQQWQQGRNQRLQFLLQSLCAEPDTPISASNADCYQQLFYHALWQSLQSHDSTSPGVGHSQHPRVQKVRALLLQHITEDIDVNWLAAQCDVSVKTLYNLFNKELGITPSVFIRCVKLQAAHDDICNNPSQNITHIATRYGFTNLSRFASYYRERFGESPSDTLRSSRSKNV